MAREPDCSCTEGPGTGNSRVLVYRPTQILLFVLIALHRRNERNVLHGRIVNERIERETYTLHWQLDTRQAPYDLEITLPGYVYHRLMLDTEKRVIVELRRQVLHIIPRDADTPLLH